MLLPKPNIREVPIKTHPEFLSAVKEGSHTISLRTTMLWLCTSTDLEVAMQLVILLIL